MPPPPPPKIPHTLDAVRVGQHFANNLVDAARYSDHGPLSLEMELADLIYSTPPVFSARFEVGALSRAGEGGSGARGGGAGAVAVGPDAPAWRRGVQCAVAWACPPPP